MASTGSSTPSLTPSRSPTPEPPVQPDHFYGNDHPQLPLSPSSDGRTWLDPSDDPLAQRGIPVFKPTMEEFQDFEGYMNKIECWGMRSGIVKVIPPKEWRDALPSVKPQLANVKLKNPIEQQMQGRAGLFRQQNIEKRKIMSVREWSELCARPELRAPGVEDVGLHARATNGTARTKARKGRRKTRDPETAEPEMTPGVMVKEEDEDHVGVQIGPIVEEEVAAKSLASPPATADGPTPIPVDGDGDAEHSIHEDEAAADDQAKSSHDASAPQTPPADDIKEEAHEDEEEKEEKPKKGRRSGHSKEAREAALAERAAKDQAFLETFTPYSDWLPPKTSASDYTPEFCKDLERKFWRTCGLGKPAWYGADMQGSLFTDETTSWNVAHLPSALSRLLPSSDKGLPGVNTPYLYFGMWRATFAWHVEDMDLFSINYIHFGAPKFWYAIPQGRASALEQTMRGYFPKDTSNCPQFLRHKSYLASPSVLSQSSVRPNTLVQQQGEFVITYPRGYHAGFNLGFNCAESVNFALESWIELGRVAKACQCVDFSVRIDVDQLLRDREAERIQAALEAPKAAKAKSPRKRKAEGTENAPKAKKPRTKVPKSEHSSTAPPTPGPASTSTSSPAPPKPIAPKVTLKLGPQPKEPDVFPCCLCVSMKREGLLRVQDPPLWRPEGQSGGASAAGDVWMAHEECANVVPETWVDEVDVGEPRADGTRAKERVVLGVDGIVKDRWNLKCNVCTKTRHKTHGAPIQCTKGRCPKAFHVSCARDGASQHIIFRLLREVEKEVVLIDPQHASAPVIQPAPVAEAGAALMDVDQSAGAPQVLKLIRKAEVELLCPQHNPAIAEAKKAAKQDKIRNELMALPPGTRIKLRVSAGVFEVTLCRVVEESKSVEVLWDRGLKREFKWGSVVFGNTELVIGQKPTEAAPEPERSLVPATATHSYAPYGAMPGSTSTFPVGPPTATYTQPYGAYTTPSTSYAPQAAPRYTQYQGSYYAGYAPTAAYQSRPPTTQYANGTWTSYQYYSSQHPTRYTVGSMYNAPAPAPTPASSSSSAQPVPSQASTSQAPPAVQYAPPVPAPPPSAQSPPNTTERPAYTAMTYQGYANYKFASGSGATAYASTPAPRSATATPSAPSTAATNTPYQTPPADSRSGTPSATQAQPRYSSKPPAPASTSLRWQQPYTGPKNTETSTATITVPASQPPPPPPPQAQAQQQAPLQAPPPPSAPAVES